MAQFRELKRDRDFDDTLFTFQKDINTVLSLPRREDMFSLVWWSVGLFEGLCKNYWMDFSKTWWDDGAVPGILI